MGTNAKSLFSKLITKKEVAFYGAINFKKLRKNFPQSISGQPIIMPSYDSKIRHDIEHWGKVNNIKFNIVVETQDISMKKLLTQNEIGILPTASHSVTSQILKGELCKIGTLDDVYEDLYLVCANRKIENSIAAHIIKEFKI